MSFYTHDNTVDSPLNNFATLNPNWRDNNNTGGTWGSDAKLNDGNLTYYSNNAAYNHQVYVRIPKGIWYFEIRINNSAEVLWFKDEDSSSSANIERTSNTSTKIYAVCTDFTTGKIWFSVNSKIAENVVDTGINPQLTLAGFESVKLGMGDWWGSTTHHHTFNFGQDASFSGRVAPSVTYQDVNGIGQFYYQPPAGALALCTANIPSGPIDIANDDVPSDYMKAVKYTATSGALNLDLGIEADLIWVKKTSGVERHALFDSVRGHHPAGGSYMLSSNLTVGQSADSSGNNGALVTSPNTTSRLTCDANKGYVNDPNYRFVAWCWKAAGAPADGQAKVINEDGSDGTMSTADLKQNTGATITPAKVSANRKSGFSIVNFNSGSANSTASIPHGLGERPDFVIVKNTNTNATAWFVWHSAFATPSNYLYLHLTSGLTDLTQDTTMWGNGHDINKIGFRSGWGLLANNNHIAYCWHSVAGYSKFGSYVGNGSVDGPFVELGFRPAWLMVKRTDSSTNGQWSIFDSVRSPINPSGAFLMADSSNEELAFGNGIDILSNGFKIREAAHALNNSSGTYIYAAFAEAPFNAPATAR